MNYLYQLLLLLLEPVPVLPVLVLLNERYAVVLGYGIKYLEEVFWEVEVDLGHRLSFEFSQADLFLN